MSEGGPQGETGKAGNPVKPSRDLTPLVPWLLAVLSGIMVGGSFPPWEHRWLTWFPWMALAPLCWALWMLPRPASSNAKAWARHCFLLGWLSGTISFLISLQWITTVTSPGWIALSLIIGLYLSLIHI